MQTERKKYTLLADESGMVLVIVLLVIMATIVLGVSVMRSSTIENKVIGNVKQYKEDFYIADSGIDYALEDFIAATTTLGITVNTTGGYTYPQSEMPEIISGLDLRMYLSGMRNPPVGKGYSVDDFRARYYRLRSTKGEVDIEAGSWKAFPRMN